MDRRWEPIKNIPQVTADSSSCVVSLGNGGALLVDSASGVCYQSRNVLHHSWILTTPPQQMRYNATGERLGNNVWLLGGWNGTCLSTVERFSLLDNTWHNEQLLFRPANFPAVCRSPSTKQILVVGGETVAFSSLRITQCVDSHGYWDIHKLQLEHGDHFGISACPLGDDTILCLRKSLVRINFKKEKMKVLTEFPASMWSDSLCTWGDSLACACQDRVWLFHPTLGYEREELPRLDVRSYRTFLMVVG